MRPMLADTLAPSKRQTLDTMIEKHIDDDRVVFEQKVDGHRVLIHIDETRNGLGSIIPLGRDGERKANAVPRPILNQFADIKGGDWYFDGELVGGTFWLFDLPQARFNGAELNPTDPYKVRRATLEGFFKQWAPSTAVQLLPNAVTAVDKRNLWERMREQSAEGVMVKTLDGAYNTIGARTHDCRKVKFINTVDCWISNMGLEGKNNAELSVYNPALGPCKPVVIGRCSLNGKQPVTLGDVVEIVYLYATDDNVLYQPRLVGGARTDKKPDECTLDQLVHTSREVWAGV